MAGANERREEQQLRAARRTVEHAAADDRWARRRGVDDPWRTAHQSVFTPLFLRWAIFWPSFWFWSFAGLLLVALVAFTVEAAWPAVAMLVVILAPGLYGRRAVRTRYGSTGFFFPERLEAGNHLPVDSST